MADDKMFVREVDQLMNVIGFVEIGRYYYETELLSTQLPSRSQVSHWQYYKLTRNSVNQLSALKIYQRGKGAKSPVSWRNVKWTKRPVNTSHTRSLGEMFNCE